MNFRFFQDPKINIEIKEDRDDGKIITCATNETIGETNITLNNVNVNGEVLTTERLHQSRRPPILYAKNTIAMGDVMMFVCDVADDVGNYRTKLNWHSNSMYKDHLYITLTSVVHFYLCVWFFEFNIHFKAAAIKFLRTCKQNWQTKHRMASFRIIIFPDIYNADRCEVRHTDIFYG